MRAINLPSLRGRISSSHALRIEVAKAVSQAEVAAKRSSTGFSAAGTDLAGLLETARLAAVRTTQAASIDVLPATASLDLSNGQTQQLAVTATYAAVPASTPVPTQTVTGDSRVTYVSSAPAVCSVSPTGLVTPLSVGTSTITVTFNGRTDTAAINVVA